MRQGIAGHMAPHAVGRHVKSLKSVFSVQLADLHGHQPGHGLQARPGRIVVDPDLVPGAVEVVDEVAPVLGGARRTVDQEDRDLPRIVGFQEIDVGTVLPEEFEGRPEPSDALLAGEDRITDVHDRPRLRAVPAMSALGVFGQDVEGDLPADIRIPGEHNGHLRNRSPRRRADRQVVAVPQGDSRRLSRIEDPVPVSVLEGEEPVPASRHQELVRARLMEDRVVGDPEPSIHLFAGDDDDGALGRFPAVDRSRDQAGIPGEGVVLPQVEQGTAAQQDRCREQGQPYLQQTDHPPRFSPPLRGNPAPAAPVSSRHAPDPSRSLRSTCCSGLIISSLMRFLNSFRNAGIPVRTPMARFVPLIFQSFWG